jgi:hypothetical protein
VFPVHANALMILFWHLINAPVWPIVPNYSTGVDLTDRMIDVYQSIGNVMAKKIAKMVMMNPHPALNAFVKLANTSVRIKTAL